MDPADLLFARLALARSWISRDVCEQTLSRVERLQALGFNKTVEDVLREGAHLDESRLRILRRLLSHHTRQARVGDYLLVRQIGTGGTGLVFEGCHRRIGRRVALKILFPRLEKQQGFAERFLREATVLARINHPNVVHAYDAGQDGDFYYIATEMVEGRDLRKILADSGPLSVPSFVEIAVAMSRGLQAIHDAGLLHRDIKPANVLVSSDRSSPSVKLVDFGLVFGEDWNTETTSDASGLVLGTPEYMSPEQIRGDALADQRSDLYSLGATFYHMLSGRVPYSRPTPQETLRAHLEEVPEPLVGRRRDVPSALVSLVESLMAREPGGRPESAEVVARLLESGEAPATGDRRLADAPGLTRRTVIGAEPIVLVAGVVLVFLIGLGIGLLPSFSRPRQYDSSSRPVAAVPREDGNEVGGPKPPAVHLPEIDVESETEALSEVLRHWERLILARRKIGDALARSWPPQWSGRVPFASLVGRLWRPPGDRTTVAELESVGTELEVSMSLADWIVESGRLVRERFRRRLALVEENQTIRALLHRRGPPVGRRVWVEDTLAGLTFVDVDLDRRYGLDEAHALMVLEWGGLARVSNEALVESVGYLVGAGQVETAARLVAELRIALSQEQDQLLRDAVGGSAREDADAAWSHFEGIIEAARLRRRGELGLLNSRWTAAGEAYRGLLALADIPDSLVGESDDWEIRRERASSLKWLTAGVFHGRTSALDALTSEALQVDYVWDAEQELRDFRARPGGWVLRYGELATATSSVEFVDTVAFFRLPLRVEIRWSVPEDRRSRGEGTRLTVFFDTIGLGVGGPSEDLQIVGLDSDADREFLSGAPTSGEDSLTVEWTVDRIVATTRGGNRINTSNPLRVPSFGRVGLRVDSGGLVESMSIQGELEPVWARARRAFVERNQR